MTSIYLIDTYEEALEKANDTPYGLAAAIFTTDINKALDFAKNSNVGMCHINGPTVHDEPQIFPYGHGLAQYAASVAKPYWAEREY